MKVFSPQNKRLIANCLILYSLVACLASVLADFRENYQDSVQADNAHKFSRIISISVAYQTKQTFSSK